MRQVSGMGRGVCV